ncbi:MAG: glycosyltransferase family 2 protein [Anaerolineales bacterium]|nr:glycosyltransferase family 2 protein [Anaerolineales bacterium]
MVPKASIIVLTWNGRSYLESCLKAVLVQDYPDFEVIVVDNASTDGSADYIAEFFPQVRLLRNEFNLGFAGGCNVGLRSARGDVLVLLNQDTEVRSDWLSNLMVVFENPQIGIAGCKTFFPDGTIQHAGGHVYGPRAETEHLAYGAEDIVTPGSVVDVDFVTGAALAVTRSALERIGLLDEGFYPAYYEDVDWCYTAREAGFRVVYVPEARLVHFESSTADRGSLSKKSLYHQGRLRFAFKHWMLENLHTIFVPSEREWASHLGRGMERTAVRPAYLKVMLDIKEIAAFRIRSDGISQGADLKVEALALLQLLEELRMACLLDENVKQVSLLESRYQLFENVWKQILPQKSSFVERLPLIGPRLAAMRQLLHALRWQVAFNARLGEMLNLTLQFIQQQELDVSENTREITLLAKHGAACSDAVMNEPK